MEAALVSVGIGVMKLLLSKLYKAYAALPGRHDQSLRAAGPSTAAESEAVARALSKIQHEICCTEAATKAAASHHLSPIVRHFLTSPAAAAPNNLVVHLALDLQITDAKHKRLLDEAEETKRALVDLDKRVSTMLISQSRKEGRSRRLANIASRPSKSVGPGDEEQE